MLAAKATMWEAEPRDRDTQLFCLTNSSLPISSIVTSRRQSHKSCSPTATKLRKPPLNLEIECQVIPPIALWPIHYAWICGICGVLAQLIKIMSCMIKGVLWSADLFLCLEAPASNTSRTSANETEMSLLCWAELRKWEQATLKPVCAVTHRTVFHLSWPQWGLSGVERHLISWPIWKRTFCLRIS